ncbi:hypothetical protein L227DRAFT_611791 [Lentinus tigrinus ALCF2SS1-6]|uniref:Zinc finger PHD-type domain-containing protein n=1 Tax=Lentinus tigrinus ALCF2SS1-6 TaxID=1328759 RepID=A0A5C2S6T2_9APHY|nr:hypothetical protein L227DRAFT_611791 [Lentinus tigrinus ALCF2SS1-6]
MARTHKNEIKTTGPPAPRDKLRKGNNDVPENPEDTDSTLVVVKRLKLHGPRPADPIEEDTHDQFCHLCHNGGDLLLCDECPRAACKAHFPDVFNLSVQDLEEVHFRCLACHFYQSMHAPDVKEQGKHKPYWGLYRKHEGGLLPWLAEPLRVEAPAHRAPHSRVNTAPIVIIHIRLADFADAGSPARATQTFLDPYYRTTRPDKLVYIDAPYCFDTVDDATSFRNGLTKKLGVLDQLPGARVLVFIFTHSEETSGDLFWTPSESSDSLQEWWAQVIPPALMTAGAKHEVTLAMLACGSLVQSPTQRQTLKSLAERMQVERVFAFGASAVLACFTGSFFMSFASSVLIAGMVVDDAHLARLLDASTLLARHTSVLLFAREKSGDHRLCVREYTWSHKKIQPWGQVLPMQCPSCRCVYTFVVKSGHDGHQHAYCSAKGCSYMSTYQKHADHVAIATGEQGAWMVRPLGPL